MFALTLVSLTLCAAPVQGTSAKGIQTWSEPSNAAGWASVAIAIDRSGETDLEALDELVSRLAGYGADVLAARGGQTRAYLLEDALVVVDSIPAADLTRALNYASARLMRPLETTRIAVERRPLPRAARAREADITLEALRKRLLVRNRVVVAAVAPGDGARLAQKVARGIRARLPSGQANHQAAFEAHTVAGPRGPIYIRPRDGSAANLAADRILAEALGGELRTGSDRIVLVPAQAARDATSARDRARATLEKTAAHPADRAMALARLGLAVTGGLPAIQTTLESGAVEVADLKASATRFGFELPQLPAVESPGGEKLTASAPVVGGIPRPGAPWAARVIAVPAKPGSKGLNTLARVLSEPERYERGYVQSLVRRGGRLSARARPEGIVIIVEGPARLDFLIAQATLEVLAGPADLEGQAPGAARRRPHTAAFWSTAFGRVPAAESGPASTAWRALDFKGAAIFVEGDAKQRPPPKWRAARPWPVSPAPAPGSGLRSTALIASQVVPFAPRVLAEGEAMAGVLQARVRRLYPRAQVRFEATRGAALLGVRIPLDENPQEIAAALEKVRAIFGNTRNVTRVELRAAFTAVANERASRRARIGDGAADLAAQYLVTGRVNGREPDAQNLARLLWTIPEPRALRSVSAGAAAAPGGSG